jgi:hypothetical protein
MKSALLFIKTKKNPENKTKSKNKKQKNQTKNQKPIS